MSGVYAPNTGPRAGGRRGGRTSNASPLTVIVNGTGKLVIFDLIPKSALKLGWLGWVAQPWIAKVVARLFRVGGFGWLWVAAVVVQATLRRLGLF